MNLVSIIMPVKNAAPYLEECLHSVMEQTYQNWELIAVDDHSADESQKILNDLARIDHRIHVLKNPGRGIIAALSHGYHHAKGNIITRMDADDLMVPDRLWKMSDLLVKCGQETIVTGLVKYFGDDPVSEGYLKYEKWINELNLKGNQWSQVYRECVIASPNWMVYREAIEKVGGFEGLSYPEDYHLVLKWNAENLAIQVITEVTLLWREHPDRTSRLSENYGQQAFFWLKINHFIQHDLQHGDLLLWGRNEKTKLAGRILSESNIPFTQLDISNYQVTTSFDRPQILVGVYPELAERKKIENYLAKLSLQEGKHWWYI